MQRLKYLLVLMFIIVPLAAPAQWWDDEDDFWDDFPDDDAFYIEDYIDPNAEPDPDAGKYLRVRHFDIAGIRLGMNYEEVREAAKEAKFRLATVDYDIPQEFRFNYDSVCRARNIVIPNQLANCIEGLAKSEKMRFISKLTFRKENNETLITHFVSPVSNHTVWKIEYENNIDKRQGTALNFQYQREERRRAFWYALTMKYGQPNVPPNRWQLDPEDDSAPMLEAHFGRITLSSLQQFAADLKFAADEARRTFQVQDFNF
ncbi:MAG: hypothetical protein FWD15_01755 [Alphaproteobacteria bacterium]|nr:hypothetical protein [Alphaproteobacteria bacterium]